jgi:thiosulfate/3-mercaptopyruvate sulfurtransferase
MSTDILLSATRLNELIEQGDCLAVDCRFDLLTPNKGRADWLSGHIPGASYAHLDEDLASGIEAHSGRHPLPDPLNFAAYLSSIGWTRGKLLVAYDAGSNAIAGRLWWLMRYFGQPSSLLDGGLNAWLEAGYALESGEVATEQALREELVPRVGMTIDSAGLSDHLGAVTVLDARSRERFSGAAEHLDTKAGHIPGALNRPFDSNLTPAGRFKDPVSLYAEFKALLGDIDLSTVAHSCGSGVTACHNLFAMELAGLEPGRLYPGSWSEWIRDPARPIETGS